LKTNRARLVDTSNNFIFYRPRKNEEGNGSISSFFIEAGPLENWREEYIRKYA
jgi:hypothetical protein